MLPIRKMVGKGESGFEVGVKSPTVTVYSLNAAGLKTTLDYKCQQEPDFDLNSSFITDKFHQVNEIWDCVITGFTTTTDIINTKPPDLGEYDPLILDQISSWTDFNEFSFFR